MKSSKFDFPFEYVFDSRHLLFHNLLHVREDKKKIWIVSQEMWLDNVKIVGQKKFTYIFLLLRVIYHEHACLTLNRNKNCNLKCLCLIFLVFWPDKVVVAKWLTQSTGNLTLWIHSQDFDRPLTPGLPCPSTHKSRKITANIQTECYI